LIINGTGLSLGLTLQTVEAEFVDQQQVQAGVSIERPSKGPIGQRRGEFLEQLGAGRVADAVTQDACGPAYGLENPTLAQASLTHQDDILAAPHEVAGGQLLNGPPIHTLGIERPIKAFQGGQFAELRRTKPTVNGPLPSAFGGLREQAMEELQVAQRFSLRRRQGRIQRGGCQCDSQCSQRGRDVVMQAPPSHPLGRPGRVLRGSLPTGV
jgi:hypothetical protein